MSDDTSKPSKPAKVQPFRILKGLGIAALLLLVVGIVYDLTVNPHAPMVSRLLDVIGSMLGLWSRQSSTGARIPQQFAASWPVLFTQSAPMMAVSILSFSLGVSCFVAGARVYTFPGLFLIFCGSALAAVTREQPVLVVQASLLIFLILLAGGKRLFRMRPVETGLYAMVRVGSLVFVITLFLTLFTLIPGPQLIYMAILFLVMLGWHRSKALPKAMRVVPHLPNLPRNLRGTRGVTLIELLIVIAMISIMIPMIVNALRTANGQFHVCRDAHLATTIARNRIEMLRAEPPAQIPEIIELREEGLPTRIDIEPSDVEGLARVTVAVTAGPEWRREVIVFETLVPIAEAPHD